MRSQPLSGLTLTLCLAACGGESSAPTSGLSLALRGSGNTTEPRGQDASGSGLVVESASAYVRHIQLDLPSGARCAELELPPEGRVRCTSGDDKLEIPGPFLVDLVAGTTQPSLAEVVIPPGTYRRVDVRFDDGRPDDGLVTAGHALDDLTLVAGGSFEPGAEPVPFELRLKFNEDARFESAAGITLAADAPAAMMLWLEVSRWFSAIDLTDCMKDGDLRVEDGKLRIDDDTRSCSDVESSLKSAIKSSGILERSRD